MESREMVAGKGTESRGRAWGCGSMIEHLPSMLKVLSSVPSMQSTLPPPKNKTKQNKTEWQQAEEFKPGNSACLF